MDVEPSAHPLKNYYSNQAHRDMYDTSDYCITEIYTFFSVCHMNWDEYAESVGYLLNKTHSLKREKISNLISPYRNMNIS